MSSECVPDSRRACNELSLCWMMEEYLNIEQGPMAPAVGHFSIASCLKQLSRDFPD